MCASGILVVGTCQAESVLLQKMLTSPLWLHCLWFYAISNQKSCTMKDSQGSNFKAFNKVRGHCQEKQFSKCLLFPQCLFFPSLFSTLKGVLRSACYLGQLLVIIRQGIYGVVKNFLHHLLFFFCIVKLMFLLQHMSHQPKHKYHGVGPYTLGLNTICSLG